MKNVKHTYLIFLVIGLILTYIGNFVQFPFALRAIPFLCDIGAIICYIGCGVLWYKARKTDKKQNEDEKNKW